MPVLNKTQFITFLRRYCREKHSDDPHILSLEHAKSEAYADIGRLIALWELEYEEEHKVGRQAQDNFLKAIETDVRKQFHDPYALIAHIHTIASHEPFLGNERLSLAAIDGFCTDWLGNNIKE